MSVNSPFLTGIYGKRMATRIYSLKSNSDEIVCATTPEPFMSVGHWYADFSQTTDEEVRQLLHEADTRESPPAL